MTGKKKWSVRYSMPGLGGVLATAGGLVFNGDITGVVSAYDADEGAVLWNFYAGSGVRGGIVSYSAGGKQYIVTSGSTVDVERRGLPSSGLSRFEEREWWVSIDSVHRGLISSAKRELEGANVHSRLRYPA